MIQGQRRILVPPQSRLLRQHPVSMPLFLLLGALGLFAVSFFSDSLFPVFVSIGVPSALLCRLIALVLGICGLLTGIISILESIDRRQTRAAMPSRPKEYSHDSN